MWLLAVSHSKMVRPKEIWCLNLFSYFIIRFTYFIFRTFYWRSHQTPVGCSKNPKVTFLFFVYIIRYNIKTMFCQQRHVTMYQYFSRHYLNKWPLQLDLY
jgi:hypothetical protein